MCYDSCRVNTRTTNLVLSFLSRGSTNDIRTVGYTFLNVTVTNDANPTSQPSVSFQSNKRHPTRTSRISLIRLCHTSSSKRQHRARRVQLWHGAFGPANLETLPLIFAPTEFTHLSYGFDSSRTCSVNRRFDVTAWRCYPSQHVTTTIAAASIQFTLAEYALACSDELARVSHLNDVTIPHDIRCAADSYVPSFDGLVLRRRRARNRRANSSFAHVRTLPRRLPPPQCELARWSNDSYSKCEVLSTVCRSPWLVASPSAA